MHYKIVEIILICNYIVENFNFNYKKEKFFLVFNKKTVNIPVKC